MFFSTLCEKSCSRHMIIFPCELMKYNLGWLHISSIYGLKHKPEFCVKYLWNIQNESIYISDMTRASYSSVITNYSTLYSLISLIHVNKV